jgi:hypothetical protein
VPDDDSAIELGDAALVGGSSVVSDAQAGDLGRDAVRVSEKGPASGSDSEIDLGDPTAVPAARQRESDVNFLAEDIVLDPSSGAGSSPGGSSRDLVAEKLESGVGLAGGKKGKEPAAEEESIEDDFLRKPEAAEESSSVDLGSMSAMPVFDAPEEAPPKSTKRTVKPAPGPIASHSEIDLDLGPPPGAKADDDSLSEVNLDDDSDPDVAELPELPPKKPKSAERVLEPARAEPPAKAPARGLATALGGLACAVAGGVLTLGGAWAGGFLSSGSGAASKQGISSPMIGAGAVPVAQQPASGSGIDMVMVQIRTGELDKVAEADLEKVEEAKADQLVARAHYHWLKYLLTERGKDPRAALKPDAEPVKKALADIEKALAANSPEAGADALFLRAEIHEETGNAAAAKADYQAGAAKFAADPTQKLRFETALQLLEMDSSRKVGRAVPALPPGLAALVLLALQPPAGGGAAPQAPAMPAEAGFAFWQAVQQARAGKYAEAIKLLDDARARHDQRRYLLPKKQQNPLSDPRERIFLSACDELKTYWGLLAGLSNPNYLAADLKGRNPRVDALLAKAGEAAAARAIKEVAAKLVKGKTVTSADDLVKQVEAERKAMETQLAGRDRAIADQKKEIANLGDKLKDAGVQLARAQDMLKATEANLRQSQAAGDAAVAALKEVAKEVSSDFTDVKTSKDALIREVRGTVKLAKSADPKGSVLRLERELAADRARLAERWEPAQMLPVWLPLLDRERGRKDLADRADRDAGRVLADPAAKPELKGQALLIQGLVLRNEEKFGDAVPVLRKAQEALKDSRGEALARCEAALKEAADPGSTVAARASELEAQGKGREAWQVIDRGLKEMPTNKGALLVQRCKLAFEAARSKGPLDASDPLVAAARDDAGAAVKEGLAEGHYCMGRLDEELGQLGDAEKDYRAALKAHGALDADGSRYRVALARVLLRQRAGAPPRAGVRGDRPFALPGPVGVLVSLTLQGVPEAPASGEAEALADEVLSLGEKAPFAARAQALAIKGLHTRAVNVSVTGLRDSHQLAPEQANNLLALLNSHPALRRTETLTRADPVKAERHYSAGVNLFFGRSYAKAEKELLAAVENDSADARYYYFLGLARLAQGKQEAYDDFEQGARLEELNRPYRAAISAALERVQGRLRRVLNEVRAAPVVEKSR